MKTVVHSSKARLETLVTPKTYLVRENERNAEARDILKVALKVCYATDEVIIGHHLVYADHNGLVQEIPSIDTFLFDHKVAQTLAGDRWQDWLQRMALLEPPERTAMLRRTVERLKFTAVH